MNEEGKILKYVGMAGIIRDYLLTFKGKESVVSLTAREARKLEGMDEYASNKCYNNVGRAMEFVAEHYFYGKQVSGTVKGNSTYVFVYEIDKQPI